MARDEKVSFMNTLSLRGVGLFLMQLDYLHSVCLCTRLDVYPLSCSEVFHITTLYALLSEINLVFTDFSDGPGFISQIVPGVLSIASLSFRLHTDLLCCGCVR